MRPAIPISTSTVAAIALHVRYIVRQQEAVQQHVLARTQALGQGTVCRVSVVVQLILITTQYLVIARVVPLIAGPLLVLAQILHLAHARTITHLGVEVI